MKYGNKVTNPGEFRTRISLQHRTVIQDAGGFQVPSWVTYDVVWSKWKNAHGNAVLQAQIEGVEVLPIVQIRYRDDVKTTDAVLKGNVRYEIIYPDNIDEKNEYIEFQAKRMMAG